MRTHQRISLLTVLLALQAGAQPAEAGDAGVAQVTPPVLLQESPAKYPEAALAERAQGTVTLALTISAEGALDEVSVVDSIHPALDAAALEAARGLKFTPASMNGEPVAVQITYRYDFQLPAPPALVAVLSGQVRIRGTKTPVATAVLVRYRTEEVLGEVDGEGRFELTLPRGVHVIEVRASGFERYTSTENLSRGDGRDRIYRLTPTGSQDPYTTTVRDDRAEKESARHVLSAQELREVPGTMGDPFRVVMLMPGVGSVASGLSYPVVRGTQPASTGYFVDGVRISALYHLGVGHAVIHPELIDRIDFLPGTPPAPFGRLLGAAVDAETRPLPQKEFHASYSVDWLNAAGMAEAALDSQTRISLSGRLSYSAWIFTKVAKISGGPQLVSDVADYQARIERDLGGGTLRLFAFGAYDRLGAQQEPGSPIAGFQQAFHRVDLRYRRRLSIGEATVAATWGYDTGGMFLESAGGAAGPQGTLEFAGPTLSARAGLESDPTSTLHLSSGLDVERRSGSVRLNMIGFSSDGSTSGFQRPSILGVVAGAWSSASWRPDPRWTVTGGLRLDSYYLSPGVHHLALEPRLSAHFQVRPELAFRAGAALMHQPPTLLFPVPVMDLAGLRYGLQESAQFTGGMEWSPLRGLGVSVDGYYSHLSRTHEFDLTQVIANRYDPLAVGQDLPGRGRAYGVEVMVRHQIGGGWFGWLSYAFQRSERLATVIDLEQFHTDGTLDVRQQMVPFALEQVHVANLALSKQFPGDLTIGAVLHFNTGRPESGLLSSRTQRVEFEGQNPSWRTISLDRADRLPPFYRLDVRIARVVRMPDFWFEAFVDVLNASNNEEVLYYEYGVNSQRPTKKPSHLPAFFPMVGVKGGF